MSFRTFWLDWPVESEYVGGGGGVGRREGDHLNKDSRVDERTTVNRLFCSLKAATNWLLCNCTRRHWRDPVSSNQIWWRSTFCLSLHATSVVMSANTKPREEGEVMLESIHRKKGSGLILFGQGDEWRRKHSRLYTSSPHETTRHQRANHQLNWNPS